MLKTCLSLFAGPLLLVLLANLVLPGMDAYWQQLPIKPGDPAYAERLISESGPGDYQILILGSSLAIWNVDEKILNRTLRPLGARSLNLGVHGSPLFATAMQLRQAIHLAPKIAVVMMVLPSLNLDETLEDARIYHPGAALHLFEPFGPGGLFSEWQEHLKDTVAWGNILYRHRTVLRERFTEGVPEHAMRHPRKRGRINDRNMVQRNAFRNQKTQDAHIDGTGPNVEALRYMKSLLEPAGTRMVVCISPFNPQARSAPRLEDYALLLRLRGEIGFDLLTERQLGTFNPQLFRDDVHLLPKGQTQLARNIARTLEPILRNPSYALQ